MTEPGRIFGVFYEPGKVFADLSQKPRWIVPMILGILFGLAFITAINSRIGWDQTIRTSIANNPRTADLTVAQREEIIQRGAKVASIIGWVGAILGPPVFMLIVAGVLTGIFNALLGTEIKFAQAFSITAYAFVIRQLYTILMILLMYLKPPEDFDIRVSPFSPAAYMSRQDNSKLLMAVAGTLDLFTFWTLIVLAIGFAVLGRKLSFTKSLITIGIPWLLVAIAGIILQSFQ